MSRREELEKLITDPTCRPLIDDMVYLEKELERLRDLPMIKVHPSDPSRQKLTPAARLYREAITEYTNILRILVRSDAKEGQQDLSPLQEWLKRRNLMEE